MSIEKLIRYVVIKKYGYQLYYSMPITGKCPTLFYFEKPLVRGQVYSFEISPTLQTTDNCLQYSVPTTDNYPT